jgi:NAD(P)-dependent dehydrogenase (short-subunit alcohol dehydrogenase family)
MEEVEKLSNLNFPEQLKTIDICACGPLRVTSSLLNGNLLQEGSKIIMITSQGGSVGWRTVQNPKGTDYGHHVSCYTADSARLYDYVRAVKRTELTTTLYLSNQMSKAAANMMAVLLAQEVKDKGVAVGIFHPGFNKTGMTAKYKEIWEVEGAVDADVGAKRIMHEASQLTMESTGKFINCEDGLEIPW